MTGTDIYGVVPEGLWSQPAIDASAIAELDGVEPIQRVRLPASITYDYIPGLAPTRFLRGLAQKKILGERSAVLGDVYVPPRGMSPAEGLPTTEQVELPHKGSVASFCVVHIGFGTNAPPTPFCSALVLLDGASVSDVDKALVRFSAIDDAQQEIAAGGTLRVSKASTGADFPGAELYVLALHVA